MLAFARVAIKLKPELGNSARGVLGNSVKPDSVKPNSGKPNSVT